MIFTALLFGSLLWGCFDYAIDEDGLLVSEDGGCYVLNFDLIDTDQKTVKSSVYPPVIDTTSCTIDIYVVYLLRKNLATFCQRKTFRNRQVAIEGSC